MSTHKHELAYPLGQLKALIKSISLAIKTQNNLAGGLKPLNLPPSDFHLFYCFSVSLSVSVSASVFISALLVAFVLCSVCCNLLGCDRFKFKVA